MPGTSNLVPTRTGFHSRIDNGDGSLSFQAVKEGLKLLTGPAKIHMPADDFEIITENGRHLGADGAFIQRFGREPGTFFSGQHYKSQKKNSSYFYEVLN